LPRVLLVDDDQALLDGLRRQLRTDFSVETALGGSEGLARLAESEPFEVVLSDFQMPRMNGAAFLLAVRKAAPDTTRMLLTGQADLTDAAKVVNDGAIFRFLLKPVARVELVAALRAGVEQHRLVTAEHDLLDRTLRGSINALTEVLSLASPAAFARATRMQRLAGRVLDVAGMALSWQADLTVMLSQVGAVALPPSVLERMQHGDQLRLEEQEMVARMPEIADQVLAGIPRLDEVREAIRVEGILTAGVDKYAGRVPFGARLLRLVRAYDDLEAAGHSPEEIVQLLRARASSFDPELLAALLSTMENPVHQYLAALTVSKLTTGIVLAEDVCTGAGIKLVSRGQETSISILERIRNFSRMPAGIQEPILVYTSTPPTEEEKPVDVVVE
jgi:response regulator RpfG family c-di-GMP phosphodiesterase